MPEGHVIHRLADEIAARFGRRVVAVSSPQSRFEASAARLVLLLTQHAEGLGEGLQATRGVVDDAAGLLRASGVEMGAVAEVFTSAVDRYRDVSAASLAALTGIATVILLVTMPL